MMMAELLGDTSLPSSSHLVVRTHTTTPVIKDREKVACAVCRSRKVKCDGTQSRCLKKPGASSGPFGRAQMMVNSPLFPAFVSAWDTIASTPPLPIHTPRYKDPLHIGDASSLWIDRAVVEKFSYRPEMFPFEVVDRRGFLERFDEQPPDLRSAMCAFAAQMSMPRAPDAVIRKYQEQARQLSMNSFDRPNVPSLQAFLIMALTSIGMGKIVPGFMFFGMATRMFDLLNIPLALNDGDMLEDEAAKAAAAEHARIASVCFMFDRTAAAITELLYTIKQESEIPLNTLQDYYERKERLLLIESKLEDWKTFLPPMLSFDKFTEGFSRESFSGDFALGQVFFFAIYHLCMCLLHRPRIRLKRLLQKQNPVLSSNPDHEINRRLVASCSKAYTSAQSLQFLLLVFKTQQITPFDQDPIIGFCILVSSLTFIELILVTDLNIVEEGVRNLNEGVMVFEAISTYLGLDPEWYRVLREIVDGNDGSEEAFVGLLEHLEVPYTDIMKLLLHGNYTAFAI
ncbi:hypothetical protein BC829DRAFT_406736 [Chytridium lagenaria]|nr:hypothetical protein BC829DRAFT_406736 [Chytridium lagenaria]